MNDAIQMAEDEFLRDQISVEGALEAAHNARSSQGFPGEGLAQIAAHACQIMDEYGPCERLEEHPLQRKDVCAFLGIRESTLSGWFKENSVPQSAKVAFFLLDALQVLAEEVRRLRKEINRPRATVAQESVPSSENEGPYFKVSRFIPSADPESALTEEILATGVRRLDIAQWIGMQDEVLNLLVEIYNVEIDYAWMCSEDISYNFAMTVKNHVEEIERIKRKFSLLKDEEEKEAPDKPAKRTKRSTGKPTQKRKEVQA